MELTKSFVINCRNVGALREFLCQAIDQIDEKDKEIAELKAKADKLHSCLKCLVMRDLIKDCPEKESAIEIVKEYK